MPEQPASAEAPPDERDHRAARGTRVGRRRAQASSAASVVAVLVVTDGAEWLPGVLATLARTEYPALELVVVDNASTDASRDLLARRLPTGRVLTLERRVGFGRAVAAALGHFPALETCAHVWLLHDDLVVAPDTLEGLVRAADADDSVGIVGPKLREWSSEHLLQEVGMTIDRLGRAESRLEIGELDQGQHDDPRDVLYVSTAGMLVRREVFREVGGFDPRFPLFRDDLDLCWRTWLAGWRVEVAPDAVAYHVAATSRGARRVGASASGARYYAERHSLATLLKNLGHFRAVALLPAVLLVGLVKVIGFAITRRFGDAVATVKAYAWNTAQLPRTLRRRAHVQHRRVLGEAELARLFAPGLPRVRAYTEALGSWLAGGSTRALIDDEDRDRVGDDQVGGIRGVLQRLAARPVAIAGVLLLVVYVIGIVPLLGGGQLVGGEISPWPADVRELLRGYLRPWVDGTVGSGALPSPVVGALGVLAFAGLGSAWAAQRLVVLGLLPLAWLLALRAGRLVTPRPLARVVGATLYVLSPVVLGTLSQGRFGALVLAALLPGLAQVGAQAALAEAPPATAWRSAGLLALGSAVAMGADPALAPLVLLLLGVVLLVALSRRHGRRGAALRRTALGVGGALALVAPWVAGLVDQGALPFAAERADPQIPLWRALSLAPEVVPGLGGPMALLIVVTAFAVAVAALLLGLRGSPGLTAGLLALWGLTSLSAWGAAWLPSGGVWVPALLLPAALAQAGLAVLAIRWASDGLAHTAFGGRQLAVAALAVVLLVGLGGGLVRLADRPWLEVAVGGQFLPAFVSADVDRVGPYRVLVLTTDDDGRISWDVVGAEGPSMATFGRTPSKALTRTIEGAVSSLVSGVDPVGTARLGITGVRYIVVPATSDEQVLAAPLDRQALLDPRPAAGARVYEVRTWLPRALVVTGPQAEALRGGGNPGDLAGIDEVGLERAEPDRWIGPGPGDADGVVLLGAGTDERWRGSSVGTGALVRLDVPGINAFEVPASSPDVAVRWTGGGPHLIGLAVQLFLGLALLSLVLRPPGTAARRDTAPLADAEDLGGAPLARARARRAAAQQAEEARNREAASPLADLPDDATGDLAADLEGSPQAARHARAADVDGDADEEGDAS